MKRRYYVNQLATTVTYTELWSNGRAPRASVLGSATSFFFGHKGRHYLVTNRHVVVDEKENHFPDRLRILLHTSTTDIAIFEPIDIELYDHGRRIWLDTPDVDIAVIDISDLIGRIKSPVAVEYSEADFPKDEDLIDVGCELVAIGYPLGFFDTTNNLPVFRKASLASPYGVSFEGKEFFLVDAILHPGTSGCPIVRPPEAVRMMSDGTSKMTGRHPYQLLGVNAGEFVPKGTETHLNQTWYPGLILDIIERGA